MRRHYIVSGRVQGVGFRQFAAENARKLKISGWVQNLPNGNVEAEAEAADALMAEFEKLLRRGPGYGHVESLLIDELPALGALPQPFEIRR